MTVVNGWTVLTPSSDSRLIYVSNAGNDTNAAAVYGRGYYLPSDPEIGPDPTNPVGPIVAYQSLWRAETRLRRTTYLGQNGNIDNYGKWFTWNQLVAIGQSHRGFPDWLLLRRGDTFVYDTEGRTGCNDFPYAQDACSGGPQWLSGQTGGLLRGRSESEPMVMTAWGNPQEARPIRQGGMAISGRTTNLRIMSLVFHNGDIELWASGDGFHAEDILLEDCVMRSAGATDVGAFVNCRLRRCVISGNYDASSHNQGMFFRNLSGYPVDSWTIEECVFDRNGYKENPNDATTWTAGVVSPQSGEPFSPGLGVQPKRSYFDRNIYVSTGDGVNHIQVTLRGNIFSRGGGGGTVQMRQGGVVDRNLFMWNEDAGYVASGAGGIYKDNVILHDDHMLAPGGWGKGFGMWNSTSTSNGLMYVMDGNIATHFHRGANGGSGFYTSNVGAGLSADFWIVGNALYRSQSGGGIVIQDNTPNAIRVSGNEIAVETGGVIGGSLSSSTGVPYEIDGNLYHSQSAAPFGSGQTFSQWQAIRPDLDDQSQFLSDFAAFKTAAGWTAPERDIVSYMESVDPTYVVDENVYVDADATVKQAVRQKVWEVLSDPTKAGSLVMSAEQAKQVARRYHAFITFIQRAKANRKGAWDSDYTAEAVSNYIREGFGQTPISSSYDDRSLSIRLSEYLEQHGPVASLVLTTQPAGGISGNPLSSQPVVTMRDASNLTVSSDNSTQVSVAIQSGTGGTLTGTTTVTVVNGVATFTDLVLSGDPLQSYILRFSISSPSLFVDSNGVSVSSEVKTPVSVDIVTAPVGGFNDGLFTTQPVLVIKDVDGAVVSTNNTTTVTVSITGGSGGVLKGTLTKTASNGVVTFTDLQLFGDEKQTYTLSFNSTGLQGTTAQVTLIEYPVIIAPVVSDLTAIRSDRYLGTVHSLDIMGEINKSELLSLRANKTKLVAVGHQDFIVNYRNTILRNRNTGYNIPEDWDLSWSIKFGPIATPNLIGPCFLWIKPEKFNVSTDGTKYNYLTDSSQISTFDNVFSAETDSTKALANYYGLNSFIPLNFDGVDDIYLDAGESGDFVIPTNIDFAFGFVIDTENVNTGNEGVVFSVGRENEDGSFQVIIDESSASRKIKIQTQAGDVKQSISTANNCYTQGESIAVVVSRVNDVFEISVNGVPEALSGTVMYDVIASGTGSFIGGVEDAVDDTKKKYLKHNLYEVVLLKEIINKPITTVIVDQLEGYFAAKYGVVLSSGHAYKSNPFRASVISDVEPDVPTLPEVSCSTLSATSSQTSFGTDASTATVTVDVENESCQWSVSKTEDWITINNGAGIGDGSFTFDVSENTGNQRTATIAVTSGTASPVFISITQAASGISATGGTITEVGGYRYHTFTSSGSFVVATGGSVEVLLVAGGGSGGRGTGGGGGGGGVIVDTTTLTQQTYSITVGGGGVIPTASWVPGVSGESSSAFGLTAIGGGGGGVNGGNGASGGSGGGGGGGTGGTNTRLGGAGTSGQGNSGGNGTATGGAGGGGGAGAAGSDGFLTTNRVGGDGGDGIEWPTGSGAYYGGGGGGGGAGSTTSASGGLGGGGTGGGASAATSGVANTGGGGGGAQENNVGGGSGGSGIVIIRYAI